METKETVIEIVETNGSKFWYCEGKLHREDGPAIEVANGTKAWYREGKVHRDDGPAIELADGSKQWWRNGTQVTFDEFAVLQQREREEKERDIKSEAAVVTKGLAPPVTLMRPPRIKRAL